MIVTRNMVDVVSTLYLAGITEDGEKFYAEQYHIRVQDKTGKRWFHEATFNGCEIEQTPDGFDAFGDIRPFAKECADRLAEHIMWIGKINLQYWYEVDPEYGSEAYINQHSRVA